jgi:hypothetical protein
MGGLFKAFVLQWYLHLKRASNAASDDLTRNWRGEILHNLIKKKKKRRRSNKI